MGTNNLSVIQVAPNLLICRTFFTRKSLPGVGKTVMTSAAAIYKIYDPQLIDFQRHFSLISYLNWCLLHNRTNALILSSDWQGIFQSKFSTHQKLSATVPFLTGAVKKKLAASIVQLWAIISILLVQKPFRFFAATSTLITSRLENTPKLADSFN